VAIRRTRTVSSTLFDPDGPARIIDAAKKVLQAVGMELGDSVLADALRRKSAKVDGSGRAYLPAELVDQALAELDKSYSIKTVSGKELVLDGRNRYYGALTVDPYIVRYGRPARRPMLSDVVNHARLGDWHKRVDTMYKMDIALADATGPSAELQALQAFMSNTTTSYFCAPVNMESARRWVEMAEIMAGGSLQENPILAGYVDSKSPLYFSAEGGEMLRFMLDRGVPMRSGPCPMAGGTSPSSLAGTLVLSLAEVLFFVAACWAYRPDSKVMVGAGPHWMNMASGEAWYFGPVKDKLHAAIREVLEHLDLPISGGFFAAGPLRLDFRTGFETVASSVLAFHVNHRTDIFSGFGSLGNACGFSPELMLWQAELVDMLEWMHGRIDCCEHKLALDAIARVGPRGHFMDDDLTLELLRCDEHYRGEVFDYERISPEQDWMELAARKVDQIVNEHEPAVPGDRLEQLQRYVRERTK